LQNELGLGPYGGDPLPSCSLVVELVNEFYPANSCWVEALDHSFHQLLKKRQGLSIVLVAFDPRSYGFRAIKIVDRNHNWRDQIKKMN